MVVRPTYLSLRGWLHQLVLLCAIAVTSSLQAQVAPADSTGSGRVDLLETPRDTIDLVWEFDDNNGDPFKPRKQSGLFLKDPANIKSEVVYDPVSGEYKIVKTMGNGLEYRTPTYMSLEDYMKYSDKKGVQDYWEEKADEEAEAEREGFKPFLSIDPGKFAGGIIDGPIEIRPQGSAELLFGINISKTDNPAIPVRQRRITTFDFDQKIQLNVTGQIGNLMKTTFNYNTEASFDFENQMNLGWTGKEDDIIQLVEAGNVTLPLKSSLITGSQSLFGLKTKLKFGDLTVTSVASQQKGEKSEIEVQGGAQIKEFQVGVDDYDQNRHFFLAQYFRDNYEEWVSTPPIIGSPINITKIEVWVTNINANAVENTRNFVAFQDLGEPDATDYYNPDFVSPNGQIYPDNYANSLYEQVANNPGIRAYTNATAELTNLDMVAARDYSRITLARKLDESRGEYTYHPQLGYISLNQELNTNQTLAVAFQYTYRDSTYQVGEFSTDGIDQDEALLLKLLKSTQLDTRMPMWDLMMKNVYSIGAYQVKNTGFELDIWYLNETGVETNYIPIDKMDNRSLVYHLGLDKLDLNQSDNFDGIFDFIEGYTILSKNGRIFFPLLEPFGSGLRAAFPDEIKDQADDYAFDSLYTNTQANARVNFPDQNLFTIKGQYESSISSEISLNALNVQQGSVTVSAGGQILTENVDYTVDYTLGRVKIINQGILESGTPIKISTESNALFSIQSRTMLASRFDYEVNEDFLLGATIMNMTERPITQKINIGNEPMSNTLIGFDGSYQTESPFLTRMIDKMPFVDTKAPSTISISGEYAQFLPGHSRLIGDEGTAYIDDFEGSQSSIDIKTFTTWQLASTPQGQADLFPEGDKFNNLLSGANRARLAWYVIDPMFFSTRQSSITPDHIRNNNELQSNHFMREILQNEVFPNKSIAAGQEAINIPTLDLAFYPEERGPYNFDVAPYIEGGKQFTAGVDPTTGGLNSPRSRWGGIMRRIETNDFDAANIEFIQFWVMDPYNEDYPSNYDTDGGYLYFNIGDVSEDLLNDGQKGFENGLPTEEAEATDLTGENFTVWGRYPRQSSNVFAFDNDPATRPFQDVGLDGLRDQEEREFFGQAYLDSLAGLYGTSSVAYQAALSDPASDNYNFYRDDDYDAAELDVLARYKKYNGLEGNSASTEQAESLNGDGYPTAASTQPNTEDINRDNNVDGTESYFQYRVRISKDMFSPENIGNNFITDMVENTVNTPNGSRTIRWYQFKVPIRSPQKAVGGIRDFRSIRFMRMFLRGFEDPVYLRFARLELVRGEWRKFTDDLREPGDFQAGDDATTFNVLAVNLEENSNRAPVNYAIPPGIIREVNITSTNLQQLNEQSLAYELCNLADGDARAAYRNVDFDMRSYKKLKLFTHVEARNQMPLADNDLRAFVRLGTDFDQNYYEYEIPVKVTPTGGGTVPATQQEIIWPEENNFEIVFSVLQAAKQARNAASVVSGHDKADRYLYVDPDDNTRKIYVKGNPNLSRVKTIMLGIRNPKRVLGDLSDDGLAKCAEVWFNELRLSDFDEEGGWAAVARASAKLADVGNIAVSGNMSTPGFGSIDKKVSERQRETIQGMDASSSLELGKFIPPAMNLSIPMYVGYAVDRSRPQFDPLQPDLFMEDVVENQAAAAQADGDDSTDPEFIRDSLWGMSQDLEIRRSINFTNVRKNPGKDKKKSHIYDVENLSFSYAYSDIEKQNIINEVDLTKTYKSGLAYNFNPQAKNIKPFENVGFLKSKHLKLIRETNFYLMPKQISIRTDVNRRYQERINRNQAFTAELPPLVNKNFKWDRLYDVKYDLTKALKLDYSATTSTVIGEVAGRVQKDNDGNRLVTPTESNTSYAWKDSVWSSVMAGGLPTTFHQSISANYKVPFNQIPLLNWVNASMKYGVDYDWQRSAFSLAAEQQGNTVQNAQNMQLNTTANMLSLYNKVDYLKKVNNKFRRQSRNKRRGKTVSKPKPKNDPSDSTETKKPKRDKNELTPVDRLVKLLMATKNVSMTYSETNGLLMPGMMLADRPRYFGMNNYNGWTPGVGFILGQQNGFGENEDLIFPNYASQNGWLVDNENLNALSRPFTDAHSTNLNLRASLEPMKDLRVELNANKMTGLNGSQFWRYNDLTDQYQSESFTQTGNVSVSYGIWRTAFISDGENNVSQVFENLKEARTLASQRLGTASGSDYSDGYGELAPDVIIASFLAAYSGKSVEEVSLDPVSTRPKPNWRVTYNGLSKLPKFKKYFRTVTLNHSYRSTMTISSYVNNQLYDPEAQVRDQNNNFITQYNYQTVTVSEQFSPLINIDMTWKNSLQTKIEFKKDRNLSMSLTNNQLTEVRGFEFVFGAGYRIKDFELPWKIGTKKPVSDINLRGDFSIRDNATIIRKLELDPDEDPQAANQATSGQKVVSAKLSADYQLNDNLTLRVYYDRVANNPVVSSSFPTANTNTGFSIRFNL